MTLFAKLLDRADKTAAEVSDTMSGQYWGAAPYSAEFKRIEGLPRRSWTPDATAQAAAAILEEIGLMRRTVDLWPAQATALADIALMKGGFFPIGVGRGKAFISVLAPMMVPSIKRPVLFVPPSLRAQTKEQVLPLASRHFRTHSNLAVLGYSELSLAKNATMLEDYAPDMIILDECHRVKNRKAGRTRRLVRYFKAHPDTICVAMSGTVSNRSLRDYAHILRWCLKDVTPLPESWNELKTWAGALDEKAARQTAPGALHRLCNPGEEPRQGFRRRLTETPGVVATAEEQIGNSLTINTHRVEVPYEITARMAELRDTWTTPNGDLVTEAVEIWRHMRELALGFWYKWKYPPPEGWMEARQVWKKYARDTLTNNRRGLDTELQVAREAAQKGTVQPWIDWKGIKDEFRPVTEAVWIDDFALDAAREWAKKPGIIWTDQVAFGKRCAEYCGLPYFGAGDDGILTTQAPRIVASITAHGEGKNLQDRYWRNLVTAPPTSGKTWEQLLGRTHRAGQPVDEVLADVFLHAPELQKSFEQAQADARYLEDTLGPRQKLNFATILC